MNYKDLFDFELGNAICYFGYRKAQNSGVELFPSIEEVKEDLILLNNNWKFIRLYDANNHAETVLEVIQREKLDLKVMIGTCLNAEINNNSCPWGGNSHTEEQLAFNREFNKNQIIKLIKLANKYSDIIFAVSAGNEATVDWTDHLVPEENVIK